MLIKAKWRLYLLFILCFCSSCLESSSSMSGCNPGQSTGYQFRGKTLRNGIKARITKSGIDFVTSQLKPILESVLAKSGQKLSCIQGGIDLPDISTGSGPKDESGKPIKPNKSNCRTRLLPKIIKGQFSACRGSSETWFYADLAGPNACAEIESESLQFSFNDAENSVSVSFSIPKISIRIKTPDIGACAFSKRGRSSACASTTVKLDDVRLQLNDLKGSVVFRFSVDPQTGQVGFKLAENGVRIQPSSEMEIKIKKCHSAKISFLKRIPSIPVGGLCTVFLKGLSGMVNRLDFFKKSVFKTVESLLENQLKELDLLSLAKVETEIPLGSLLENSGISGVNNAKSLGLLLTPSKQFGIVNQGLNIGVDTGFESVSKHACVPQRPMPKEQPSQEPSLNGDYHFATSISQATVNQALWAAYQTGALCIRLTSQVIADLTKGGFSLNAGIFELLVPKLTKIVPPTASVFLQVRPTKEPKVRFGSGQRVNGLMDSTIHLELSDFQIEFYVMHHDRFIRLFSLYTQINLGIGLIPTPDNKIELAIDMETLKLSNLRIEDDILLKTVNVKKLLPTLVSFIVKSIGDKNPHFDFDISQQLSNALGLPLTLTINNIAQDGSAKNWLTLKMTMGKESTGDPLSPATVAKISNRPNMLKGSGSHLGSTGQLFLRVPEFWNSHRLEYQYIVDFGSWSTFKTASNGVLRLNDPLLHLTGKHRIWVRSRIRDQYKSLEKEAFSFWYTFDPVPPKLSIHQENEQLVILAEDSVSKKKDLRTEIFVNEKWQSLQSSKVSIKELKGHPSNIKIRAIDREGNQRKIHWSLKEKKKVFEETEIPALDLQDEQQGFGCSVLSNSKNDSMPLFVLCLILITLCWKIRSQSIK